MDNWLLTHDGWAMKWGIISFLICMFLVSCLIVTKCNPLIWHIPRNIYRTFIYIKRGRRSIAYIKGTWRVVKGGYISASGYLHTNKIFPENETFCLSESEFYKVKVTESDEEIREKVIALNVKQLKMIHPLRQRKMPRGRPQDPFAEPEMPHYNDPFNDLDLPPNVRQRLEQLYDDLD